MKNTGVPDPAAAPTCHQMGGWKTSEQVGIDEQNTRRVEEARLHAMIRKLAPNGWGSGSAPEIHRKWVTLVAEKEPISLPNDLARQLDEIACFDGKVEMVEEVVLGGVGGVSTFSPDNPATGDWRDNFNKPFPPNRVCLDVQGNESEDSEWEEGGDGGGDDSCDDSGGDSETDWMDCEKGGGGEVICVPRIRGSPQRFAEMTFAPGSNNGFCPGRQVDTGHSTDNLEILRSLDRLNRQDRT